MQVVPVKNVAAVLDHLEQHTEKGDTKAVLGALVRLRNLFRAGFLTSTDAERTQQGDFAGTLPAPLEVARVFTLTLTCFFPGRRRCVGRCPRYFPFPNTEPTLGDMWLVGEAILCRHGAVPLSNRVASDQNFICAREEDRNLVDDMRVLKDVLDCIVEVWNATQPSSGNDLSFSWFGAFLGAVGPELTALFRDLVLHRACDVSNSDFGDLQALGGAGPADEWCNSCVAFFVKVREKHEIVFSSMKSILRSIDEVLRVQGSIQDPFFRDLMAALAQSVVRGMQTADVGQFIYHVLLPMDRRTVLSFPSQVALLWAELADEKSVAVTREKTPGLDCVLAKLLLVFHEVVCLWLRTGEEPDKWGVFPIALTTLLRAAGGKIGGPDVTSLVLTVWGTIAGTILSHSTFFHVLSCFQGPWLTETTRLVLTFCGERAFSDVLTEISGKHSIISPGQQTALALGYLFCLTVRLDQFEQTQFGSDQFGVDAAQELLRGLCTIDGTGISLFWSVVASVATSRALTTTPIGYEEDEHRTIFPLRKNLPILSASLVVYVGRYNTEHIQSQLCYFAVSPLVLHGSRLGIAARIAVEQFCGILRAPESVQGKDRHDDFLSRLCEALHHAVRGFVMSLVNRIAKIPEGRLWYLRQPELQQMEIFRRAAGSFELASNQELKAFSKNRAFATLKAVRDVPMAHHAESVRGTFVAGMSVLVFPWVANANSLERLRQKLTDYDVDSEIPSDYVIMVEACLSTRTLDVNTLAKVVRIALSKVAAGKDDHSDHCIWPLLFGRALNIPSANSNSSTLLEAIHPGSPLSIVAYSRSPAMLLAAAKVFHKARRVTEMTSVTKFAFEHVNSGEVRTNGGAWAQCALACFELHRELNAAEIVHFSSDFDLLTVRSALERLLPNFQSLLLY